MNLKHGNSARTDRETELIQRLRSRPDLWERFEAILALTEVEGGGHCTREAGWGLASRIHVVADGAEWITLQSREVFGTQAGVLTDFYHVSEYLAAAAAVCRARAAGVTSATAATHSD